MSWVGLACHHQVSRRHQVFMLLEAVYHFDSKLAVCTATSIMYTADCDFQL